MLFNSVAFLLFAAVFFAVWPFAAPRSRPRWIWVTAASLFFYGWWDWRYVPLLVATALVDFGAGLAFERFPNGRRAILVVSLVSNLGVLGLFKYAGLFARTINQGLNLAGAVPMVPVIDLVLPLGISFYTFQSMSYTIDVYRGQIKPTRDPFHFMAYVSLFPQLVAGPIVRARELLPQLERWKRPEPQAVWDGLRLIAAGYFKKMVIADNLAVAVNVAYGGVQPVSGGLYWWTVALMFSVQVYCDFSGYSDIARGLGKWIGYEFPVNFDHPYALAATPREFWSRWHISMSTWFRDYLYIPLGGSKTGHATRNLIITFLLMGLWHGAGWNFVAFGALHGLWVILDRSTGWPERLARVPGGRALSWAVMMAQVAIAAAVFRCQSVDQALSVLHAMLSPFPLDAGPVLLLGMVPLLVLAGSAVLEWFTCFVRTRWAGELLYGRLEPAVVALLLAAAIFLRGPSARFVYFQF